MLTPKEFCKDLRKFHKRGHSSYDLLYSWMWCQQQATGAPVRMSDVWNFMCTQPLVQFTPHFTLVEIVQELTRCKACTFIDRDNVHISPPSEALMSPVQEILN